MVEYSKKLLIISLLLLEVVLAVELPFRFGSKTCASLMSSFDPIKVDINFPKIANKRDGQHFIVKVIQYENSFVLEQNIVGAGSTFRHSYELKTNKLYQICIQSEGSAHREETVYINFIQIQDFQSLIGRIQIPQELLKEEKLQKIYVTSGKLHSVIDIIQKHQQKERKLQDQIVTKNIHKSNRILTLGLIEILVIILSGLYQILSLRKFLIEQNLY